MDDSRLQFSCQIFVILLVVHYRSIQKRLIFGSLADTEFRSGKIRKFCLARSYLTTFMVFEDSLVLCCVAQKK